MAAARLHGAVREVFDRVRDAADHGDGELLTRYRTVRDQDAFGSLVRRHGPMVLGVCRRVLRDRHAADDAFQATFLVLAKKADAVRPPERLAPWLHGVAYRTALKLRGRAFRRQQVEQAYARCAPRPAPGPDADLAPVIDEQLNALPEKYRAPLVLCALQGLNKAQAAERLGLPEGTVSSRLARAREMLRDRLTRRGVVVPAAALAAFLSGGALRAALPPPLAAAAGLVTNPAAIPATVLTLSNEVIRSMAILKLKFLGTLALSAVLVGGGLGVVAVNADDKKPQPPAADPVNKPKPEAQKPQPDKPRPDGEKKPAARPAGRVGSVDPKANTITVVVKGDGEVTEKVIQLAATTKVFIDGKEAKLEAVPKGALAALVAAGTKDAPEVAEVRVTGPVAGGVINQVDVTGITLAGEKNQRAVAITADTKVVLNGKDAKPADLKPGDRVQVTLTTDEKAALAITGGKADAEKPGAKPAGRFGAKVVAVDAANRLITLDTKTDSGVEVVVRVADDGKVTVDGKPAKLGDLPKGATVALTRAPGKEGQPREVSEVVATGETFAGAVKQVDGESVTVATKTEKARGDRAVKLAPGGKVTIDGKDAKLADLKPGDRVSVTLTTDGTSALGITAAAREKDDEGQ